jgi:hypothetical protein
MAQQDRQAWREGAMTPIGSILERNIILNGADVLTAKGAKSRSGSTRGSRVHNLALIDRRHR